jgi:hypothetical protein
MMLLIWCWTAPFMIGASILTDALALAEAWNEAR